jgi:SAM-dependent methyltransferase
MQDDALIEQLRCLYRDNSKHSHYQNVPIFVRDSLGYSEAIDESWRGDTARYEYLVNALALQPGQLVADVGANTGYFVLSLAYAYPQCQFVAYETNSNQVQYMRLIVKAFGLTNIRVEQAAITLAEIDSLPVFDCMLHLNVLHHAGCDFDSELVCAPREFPPYAKAYLTKLAGKATTLAFQMGYNWGGNKSAPLVSPLDQLGMLSLLTQIFATECWRIESVSFPAHQDQQTVRYIHVADSEFLGQKVSSAIDACHLGSFKGEFYRRPLLLSRSLLQL